MDRERKIRRWGDNVLTESELYKELGILTKEKERWKANVPYVASGRRGGAHGEDVSF